MNNKLFYFSCLVALSAAVFVRWLLFGDLGSYSEVLFGNISSLTSNPIGIGEMYYGAKNSFLASHNTYLTNHTFIFALCGYLSVLAALQLKLRWISARLKPFRNQLADLKERYPDVQQRKPLIAAIHDSAGYRLGTHAKWIVGQLAYVILLVLWLPELEPLLPSILTDNYQTTKFIVAICALGLTALVMAMTYKRGLSPFSFASMFVVAVGTYIFPLITLIVIAFNGAVANVFKLWDFAHEDKTKSINSHYQAA